MQQPSEAELRKQLVALLEGGQAHLDFSSAVAEFPVQRAGETPNGVPHSGWQLLEHLRITQRDILEFSLGTDYKALAWPQDYWPAGKAPKDVAEWEDSVRRFEEDLAQLKEIAGDSNTDLYTPFAQGEGQNWIRELLLVADHNSHHLGQLIFLKKMLLAH